MPSLVSDRMRSIEGELSTVEAGRPTVVLDSVGSTNRWLKEAWAKGHVRHGTAVWADEQTQGRGRLGRAWESPPGKNIYTSVLWEPPRERLSGVLSLMAGVAAARSVREYTGLDARMKWPNDGVIGSRKFCGILVEAGVDPSPWAVVGIGINVLGQVGREYPNAVTLEQCLKSPLSREDLWLKLMSHLEAAYTSWIEAGDNWAIHAWTQHNATLGHMVRVEKPGQDMWVGRAESVASDGGLWVANAERREKVISGEVSLRLADGGYAPESD